MILKPALAAMIASGLIVPEAPKLVLPKPAIVKRENLEFWAPLLGMPLTMGMLAPKAVAPFFIDGNAGSNSASATSRTWTHTTTSATTALVVGAYANVNSGVPDITNVTFNGVALTEIRQTASGNLSTAIWWMLNPPVGSYSIVVSFSGSDRGVAGSSLNLGGVSAVDVDGGGGSGSTTTDPFSTTVTAVSGGIPIANVGIEANSSTLNTVSVTSPTGMTLAHTANRFTSNSFAKYQALFYSNTLVAAGSQTLTADVTAGTINGRSQQFVIFK
jgi:hypothetical protein